MKKIPVYQPSLSGNEKKYVDDCLDTTWISSKGKYLALFEEAFAERIGVKYAAGTNNGTTAVHLAVLALGIGPGDEVIVPTLTYIASVNAIAYTGAKPVFVDSESKTWQMDTEDIKKKISPKTKAIMAVHLYGHPCNMDEIMSIAKEHNLYVIEDAAEAFGTYYDGKQAGSIGDIAAFSFFGNKTITCGEGGMVVTNDPKLDNLVRRYKGQGLADHKEYWHDLIGFNHRMTNIAAAIGLAQLEQADNFISRKREIAKRYERGVDGIKGVFFHPEVAPAVHSYWMSSILLEDEKARDRVRQQLNEAGIETRPLFNPVHRMPMYEEKAVYPVAEDLGRRGINLPSFPALTDEDVDYIIETVKKALVKDLI